MNKDIYKLFKEWQRVIALLLVICLTAVMAIVPGGGMTSYASTAMENEDLSIYPNDGSCDTTRWIWGSSSSYDFRGLGQNSSGSSINIRTTYGSGFGGGGNGYATALYMNGAAQTIPAANNGQVFTINVGSGATQAKIEGKIWLHPSADGQYVLQDYYFYNSNGKLAGNSASDGMEIKFSFHSDVMMGNHDAATIKRFNIAGVRNGIHMVDESGNADTNLATMDLIIEDESLGITGDTATGGNLWAGKYSERTSHLFDNSTADVKGIDSGIACGYTFKIHPYEMVHKRVAWIVKGPTYYVSTSGNDTNAGTTDAPLRTIQKAVSNLGNKKGYIYIMDDMTLSESDKVAINTSKGDITISATDIVKDSSGNQTPYSGTKKITYTGTSPLFTIKGGAKVNFLKLTLDGANVQRSEPLIKSTGSYLQLNKSTVIQNCYGVAPNMGSAVQVDGGGVNMKVQDTATTINQSLNMSFATIQDCVSTGANSGAVYYDATGAFVVMNDVQITDNTDGGTGKANVFLPAGKQITVGGSLSGKLDETRPDEVLSAQIGVTLAEAAKPQATLGGVTSQADQEVIVAKPLTGSAACIFADNFSSDDTNLYTGAGSRILNNGATVADNTAYTVIKQDGCSITLEYKEYALDDQAQPIENQYEDMELPSGGNFATSYTVVDGNSVDSYLRRPAQIAGFELVKTEVKSNSASGTIGDLAANNTGSYDSNANFGDVTGHMPGNDITVTYYYKQASGSITFHMDGGKPQYATVYGIAGDPTYIGNYSDPTKYGYIFLGWSKKTKAELLEIYNNSYSELAENFPTSSYKEDLANYYTIPTQATNLHAIFGLDMTKHYMMPVEYLNESGSIVIGIVDTPTGPDGEQGYVAESAVSASPLSVYGYTCDAANSVSWNFEDGSFDPVTGEFSGTMPAVDTRVSYRYKVDRSNASTRPHVTVRYVNVLANASGGHDSVKDDLVYQQFPEDILNISPASDIYNYEVDSWAVTGGDEAGGDGVNEPLVFALQGSFDDSGNFTGTMPNQDVEITYYYAAGSATYKFTTNYVDGDSLDELSRHIEQMDIVSPVVDRVQADSQVMSRNLAFYGYEGYTNATFELNQPSDYTAYTLDNTTQDFTGTMPAENLEITYSYGRDDRYWAKLVFEAGESGVLRGRDDEDDGTAYRDEVSKDVSPAANASSSRTATFNTKVLANIEGEDANEAAYTWQEIVDKKLVPQVKADKYYRVKGWAIDENKDGVYDASVDTLLTDDSWFTKPLSDTDYTIYVVAVYEENPLEWIDITFKVDNGSLAAGTDGIVHSTMHIQYDKTWQDVIARADFPQTTAIANYLPSQWHDSDNKVMGAATAEDDMNLQHHGTVFTFVYYKDPSVFGTYASTPQATAMLDSSGKGNVIVHGTTSGYQYIITDRDGNIIGIQNGNSAGTNIFEDMNPGSEYKVYEALGETDASIGGRIEDVKISEEASLESAEYGTSVSFLSNPATVLVPAVETNYQVRFDTENDGRTVLVINPADPDSDYALVDKDGNPVVTPETDGSGWQTPAGSPAKVTFTGLDYNASYTVVTRPSGDGNVGVNDKLDQGTSLMTDPSGDLDIPAYVVETINGAITKAGDFEGSSTREDVEAGDTITVKAEAKNDDNRDFLYWKVLVGSIPDLGGTGGKIEQQEITFTMPETNVVMAAYYQSSSNPSIDSEVRGGNAQEMALDPSDADSLRDALTTDADQTLIDVNGAKIEYKIVYRKTSVRATETEAVKESGWYNDEYAEAYHGAWGLSVEAERYVDGRRVDRATPAEATFTTYVQLDGDDVDMLDYMLFRVDEDPTEDGQYILTEESFDGLDGIETEHEGGLFTFEAQLGKRYILVYNKANWIYFINNHVSPIYSYGFKARKGEPVSDSLFFDGVEEQVDYLLDEQTGVEYNYIGWSSQEDDYREYDPEKDIKKKTFIYAYYDDTKEEVDSTRDELYEAIMDLLSKSEDYFMKQAEASELRELVDEALALLEQTEPRATIGQLNEILLKVQESIVQSDEVLEERYDNYDQIKTHSSGSGGGGGGGTGGGKKGNSFVQERSTVYGTGNVNGSWSIDETTGRTTFVLTGGLPLTSSWAILENPNGTDISKGWYHFDSSGNMDIGWFTDEKGDWYYSSPVQDDKYGQMQTSWHIGDGDTHWYYLDPNTGAMAKGWVMVDGKWYYFTEKSEQPSYTSVDGVLQYTGNGARPMGSMYVNEMTPDGYMVGADGAWIQ